MLAWPAAARPSYCGGQHGNGYALAALDSSGGISAWKHSSRGGSGAPGGTVDILDVVLILRMTVGLEVPTEEEFQRANVSPAEAEPGGAWTPTLAEPRRIDITDVVLTLRVAVGLVDLTEPA